MKKLIFSLVAASVFVACDEKNPNDFIVDDGELAFKQSEQIVELTPSTETVRIEMYYTEEPSEDRYGYVHLMYDAQKSTENIETLVAIPTYVKWEVAEDGTLYYDMYINAEQITSEVCAYLYVGFGNEANAEHHREMLLRIYPQWYLETTAIAEFVAECKDFDAEVLVEGLAGEWEMDSMLEYDAEWAKIEQPHRVMGVDYAEGLGYSKLTFNADGTGNRYVEFTEPGEEPETMAFEWQYNADSHMLTLSGDYNAEFKVAGFNGDHIVCDYVYHGDNMRKILKRKTE